MIEEESCWVVKEFREKKNSLDIVDMWKGKEDRSYYECFKKWINCFLMMNKFFVMVVMWIGGIFECINIGEYDKFIEVCINKEKVN